MVTKKIKLRAGYPIEFEVSNGHLMVNATSLCAAWGFDAMSWGLAKSTRYYFYYVKEVSDFLDERLMERRWGRNSYGKDLWVHESLVLRLGQWLDANSIVLQQHVGYQDHAPAKVERQCEKWLAQLMPESRVQQLRQKHIEVLRAEAQFIERKLFMC